jgi:limonene-1,2-epoxide hydrolase
MSDVVRNEDIVRRFIGQFRESWPQDLDLALAPLADDASYQISVPTIPPLKGRAAIKAELLRMQQRVIGQKHDMKTVAASGNTVFTERVDYSKRVGGEWAAIPLVAVFELDGEGRITTWREFMDLGAVASQHGMTFEQLRQAIAA